MYIYIYVITNLISSQYVFIFVERRVSGSSRIVREVCSSQIVREVSSSRIVREVSSSRIVREVSSEAGRSG